MFCNRMEEQKLLKRKSKAVGNNNALVSVCTELALYYISKGQYSKAIKEYELTSNIHKQENKMILYAQVNRGIGEAYLSLQQFDKCREHFKIYYDVAVKEENILEQQRALAQLGHLYLTWYFETFSEQNMKLLHEAYSYFMKSMKKCDSLSDNIEKQDMLARLFSNLGLVKENLGDYDTALKLYEKCVKICLKYDIYEQLYRAYRDLAALYDKQEMYHETVKNYNLAIEVAKKLSSRRVELICEILFAKSKTLIKIADFQGAKQVLRKAYKFKTPNQEERRNIERYLRIVASMCKMEDDIITCTDQKKLKTLYEQMGDGACDLKNFTKAIEYYKKMLEVAEKTGASEKELGICYYSLGETYKDNGDYKEAEIYLEKEYNLCKDDIKDSLNSLSKIADLKETANASPNEIKLIYEKGLASCRAQKNVKEEKRFLLRYINFLRRNSCNKDAFELENYLSNLTVEPGDSENSSSSDNESDGSAVAHIGDDIILSDITDVSEQSDDEVPEVASVEPSKRRKQTSTKFRRNKNGEWPLHVACIQGNKKMVQYWLGVDHPVNVRDNAGWLPLHEAAVHGHLEIVRLLLDHRASINDRGGSQCDGITPLHDACCNGHLEVVELLLDRGASAVAKTDEGSTPLLELKKWYDRVNPSLSQERLCLYRRLIQRMQSALEKAGQNDVELNRSILVPSPEEGNITTNIGKLRRRKLLEETPEDHFEEETPDSYDDDHRVDFEVEKNVSNEYQMIMQSLRHKYSNQGSEKISPSGKPSTSKRSALIDEEDFVAEDEWLEDDMRPAKNKKRRTDSGDFLWGSSRSFEVGNNASKSPAKSVSSERSEDRRISDELPDLPQNMFAIDLDETSSDNIHQRNSSSSIEGSRSSLSKRRTQATLLDAGFSRARDNFQNVKRSNLNSGRVSSERIPGTSQSRITNYGTQATHTVVEADSTTLCRSPFKGFESTPTITDPMLFVDVEIEKKVFRVPFSMSQMQIKTIKWLAEEAAHRFESKEFMKPILELETVNGVILADSDLLSLLFPMGSMQAERVVGKVTEWSLPSVLERYKETCAHMGVDADRDLCDQIQSMSLSLDIPNQGLLGSDLNPLLKAINNQKALTEINLSGNYLNNHAMTALCASIITLPNLQTLNLSCTGLQRSYLSLLASTLATNVLGNLINLDLSDNRLLRNSSLEDIAVITKSVNVKRLNLSNIGLTDLSNLYEALNLKTVEQLDISNNELKDGDLKKIVSWLDACVVRKINLSRNQGHMVLRQVSDIFTNQPAVALEAISLEKCGVTDSDLFELLRFAPNVTSIDLRYNPDLTTISLRRLLENGNLSHIDLTACDNIWNLFDPARTAWLINLKTKGNMAVFKISGEKEVLDSLLDMFREKYRNALEITEKSISCLTIILKAS